MIIFNHNRILKKRWIEIYYFASMVSFGYTDDHAQDISIWIFNKIKNFDPTKSSLKYYVHVLIKTSYRKIVFDRKKQQIFEDDFVTLIEEVPSIHKEDNYNKFISEIVTNLKNSMQTAIFFAIVYNKGEKNYTEIAEMFGMKYATFVSNVKNIREVAKKVMKEHKDR